MSNENEGPNMRACREWFEADPEHRRMNGHRPMVSRLEGPSIMSPTLEITMTQEFPESGWEVVAAGAGYTKEEAAGRCLEMKAGDDVWSVALHYGWEMRAGEAASVEVTFADGTSLVRNSARELWDELVRTGRIEPLAVRMADKGWK